MRRLLLAIALTLPLFVASRAPALDFCYYKMGQTSGDGSCPDPNRNTVSGGAFPSFSDALNINPASIPTSPTPLGFELIGSSANILKKNAETNLALIKGFDNFGSAFSTNSDKTFYSQNLERILSGTVLDDAAYFDYLGYDRSSASMSLGSAVGLPLEALKKFTIPTLGLGLRYNRASRGWDLQPGFSINGKYVTFGYSTSKQSSVPYYGEGQLTSYSLGVKLGSLRLDYTHTTLQFELASIFGLTASFPTDILTASLRVGNFLLTGAYRSYYDAVGTPIKMGMGGANYRLNQHLALGYLYGYIPKIHSLGAQIFL